MILSIETWKNMPKISQHRRKPRYLETPNEVTHAHPVGVVVEEHQDKPQGFFLSTLDDSCTK